MTKLPIAITLCLTVCLCAGLALADHHGTKKDKADQVDDGWVSLMPEEGLDGWATKDAEKYWQLKDGVLTGQNSDKKESRLWTDAEYGDFELIVEYQAGSEAYDTGVYLHGSSHQVQIGISRSQHVDLTGGLYCPKDGNGKYPQMDEGVLKKVKDAHKLGKWNTLRITTKGKHIKTFLNGELINDYQAVKYADQGKIGLQLHSGLDMKASFRNIRLRVIDSE